MCFFLFNIYIYIYIYIYIDLSVDKKGWCFEDSVS